MTDVDHDKLHAFWFLLTRSASRYLNGTAGELPFTLNDPLREMLALDFPEDGHHSRDNR